MLFHVGLAPHGYIGVDVFFVLSGFLITRLIVAEFEKRSSVALRQFYLRRALRLYPALVTVVGFCILVSLVTGRRTADIAHDAALSLTYVSNLFVLPSGLLDHTWTLALEEQFYLVWPALLLVALRKRRRWSFAPALAVVGGLLLVDLATGRHGAAHSYVRAMGLPLGCAVGLADVSALRRLARFGWPALVGLLAIIVLPAPGFLTTGWPISIGAVFAAPVTAMLVVKAPAAFEAPGLQWLGLRSYSLYLWHFPLLALARHHAPASVPTAAALAVGLAGSVITADLSYRLVERPVMRYRDRRRLATTARPVPA